MTRSIVKKAGKTGLAALAVVAIMALAWAVPAGAAVQIGDGFSPTTILKAGQNIDAGTVDVVYSEADDAIVVTYNTEDGWELVDTHLWVGTDISQMPQTKKGSPKIGHFPYVKEGIAATSFSFSIPFEEAFCGSDILFAAHAVVRKMDPRGKYQTETGWGYGTEFVEASGWGTYFPVGFTCGYEPVDCPSTCADEFSVVANQIFDLTVSDWKLEIKIDYSGDFDQIGINLPKSTDGTALFFTSYGDANSGVLGENWPAEGIVEVTYFYKKWMVPVGEEPGETQITVWGRTGEGVCCTTIPVGGGSAE